MGYIYSNFSWNLPGNWLDNATQYYVELNVLKLDDLDKFEIARFMHQLVNDKFPLCFLLPYFFVFYSHKSNTLANNEIVINGTRFRTFQDLELLDY